MNVGNNPPHPPVTVALETLGCKLNQAETEQLARQLKAAGCIIVPPDQPADIYILNTCTVTHVADRKTRHSLRMAHRRNPEGRIIALGCSADQSGQELAAIEGVDLVLGNDEKHKLPQILAKFGNISQLHPQNKKENHNRTRSFIKAQDGCNNFCTYCIVPLVRGREKSLSPENVVSEIQSRVNDGYQEVVLTGTEIGRYDSCGVDLKTLLKKILSETSISRLRLSSLQPQEIDQHLLELWQDRRLCRHFHLSLQSGSDTVLQRMNRRYTASDYILAVERIRAALPEAAITTDIIVGFPGETDNEFAESYQFCQGLKFARIHIFMYSPRKGTPAARMKDQVEPTVKKQRSEKMLALGASSMREYECSFIDKEMKVLFEQAETGYWSGYTDTYFKVFVKSEMDLANQILPVKITGLKNGKMLGEMAE